MRDYSKMTNDQRARRELKFFRWWNVYLRGKLIDEVGFNTFCEGGAKIDAEHVKDALINHDGYDPNITVELS